MHTLLLGTVLRSTLASDAPAMAQSAAMNDGLVLNGVTIVDTHTGKLMPNMTIFIKDGKISKIVPAGDLPETIQARSVEAHGKFVVPGFLDMHVHVLQDDDPEPALALMLANGITGFRQMAGSPQLLELRQQGKLALGNDAPELLETPGEILTYGNAPNPDAARAEVRKQKAEGADFIKIIFTDDKTFFAALQEATRQGLPFAGHLPPTVSAAEASKKGMRAIEHLGPIDTELISCSTLETIVRTMLFLRPPPPLKLSPDKIAEFKRMVIDPILLRLTMDPDAINKSQRLIDSYSEAKCRKLAQVFVAHQTWQVPTLIRSDTSQSAEQSRFINDPNLRYVSNTTRKEWISVSQELSAKLTPQSQETLRQLMEIELKITKLFDQNGVKMLAGTDYGGIWVIPGFSLHQEFDLLKRAGLSPLKVLQMTTLNGAEFLNRQATSGSVEEGKDANLVLLDGNPIDSVQNLHQINAVIRGGTYYSKEALEGLKKRVADLQEDGRGDQKAN